MNSEKSKEILKLVDSFFIKSNHDINNQADILNKLTEQLKSWESIKRFIGSFSSEEDKEVVKRKIYPLYVVERS